MNVRCPDCRTLFRVDPARVPDGGVDARCSRCGEVFAVRGEDATSEGSPRAATGGADPASPTGPAGGADAAVPAQDEPAARPGAENGGARPEPARAEPGAGGASPAGDAGDGESDDASRTGVAMPVGGQDADTRARRIARALVSDIVAYHSDRLPEDADAGAVRRAYRDEILKSWEEYVAQVGREMAEGTMHFRRALNEILAGGEDVF